MHYYSFNIKDFSSHTAHLTLEEECVYRRLLDHYYDTEKPIPTETKSVIRRLRLGSYVSEFEQVLSEFFTLEDDGYHNYRADIEIAAYQNKANAARENGKKGGRPPKNKGQKTQPVKSANQIKTSAKANQEPLTNNQEPLTNNQGKEISSPTAPDPVYPLFEYWREVMGKSPSTKPTPNRIAKIKARLKDGYTAEQIKQAIDGCRMSDYHMGKNDSGKVYDCLTLICRSAEKLEQFIGYTTAVNPDQQREQEVDDWVNGMDQQPYTGGETIDHE